MKAIIDYYQVTPNEFSKLLGFDRADKIYYILNGKFYPSFEILLAITNKFVNVSMDWLITGKGQMLHQEKKSIDYSHASEPSEPYVQPECKDCKLKDKVISALEQQVSAQQKLIEYLESAGPKEEGQKRKVAC